MESPSVEEKVLEIVREGLKLDKDAVTLESRFLEDLHTDSLDRSKLMMEAEDEFDLAFPDDAAEQIKTVGDAVAFIEEQLKVAS